MRKSYIALSLILSQALCVGATATDVIADFSDKNGGTSADGKLKPSSVTKPNGQPSGTTDATAGTDWSGGDYYLNVMTDGLTFNFSDTNSGTNLVIKNGFNFTNRIPKTDGSTATQKANITITKNGGNPINFTFGLADSTSISDKITLGSDINLNITGFTSVAVKSNLSIGANSTLDTSTIASFTNDGGIVLEGKDSILKIKDTLTNNGTIMMKGGSSIKSGESNDLKVLSSAANDRGSIIVQGEAEITTNNSTLTIESQDITLQSLVSKKDSKVEVVSSSLTLKSTNTNGTLALGDTDKTVNITGEIGNKDPSNIPNSEIPVNSEVGKIVVDGFATLDLKNVNFKNINLTSTTTNAISLKSGVLGLENTIFSFGDTSTDSQTPPTPLNLGVSGTSTITLAGENAISTTGDLTIIGTHTFKGDGTLDFVGDTVKLGNGMSSKFELSGSDGSPKIGVKAKSGIATNAFELTGLTLQAIESAITNTSMTLSDSILEAIDSEGNLSNLTVSGSSGTINVVNGTTAILRGSGISLAGQNVTLANGADQLTTLTLNAGSGGVTLDNTTITGENSLKNNALNIHSSTLTAKGKITLENVALVSDRDLTIVGTEKKNGNSKGLSITVNASATPSSAQDVFSTIFVGKKEDSGVRFRALTLASQKLGEGEQAYVSIENGTKTVDFRASSFTFQNQEINLANSATGAELRLFAYGNEVIEERFYKMSGGSKPEELSGSGAFNFSNTTFTNGSTSTVELYAGNGGVNLLPANLTLNGVSIDAKIIDDNGGSSLNSLNLSASNGSINVLGTSTIQASKFIYGDSQGIGVDLNVGNETTKGNLTLKGTANGGSDNFILGGEVALDLRGTGGATSIDIEIQNGTAHKLSDNSLGLTFRGGGLTVIGSDAGSSTHTFKAKSFTFEEIKGTDDAVITSPFVKVQNAELTLNGGSTMTEINLVGKVYLEGAVSGSNGISKLLATSNGGGSGNSITLKLHDIEAIGNSTIDSNKIEFVDSNIVVSNSGDKGLMLLDKTASPTNDTIAGTINSITLNNGKLAFQYNTSSDATITLNADSVITSSGNSSLTLKTIKVGDGTTGLYSLKVIDGTFTLTEKDTTGGTQLGAITLGDESTSISGAGATFEYKNNSGYHTLTLKGNLTSYGNSSIIADSFTINAKEKDEGNYAISSTGGTLTLQSKKSSADRLDLTADLTLNSGGLKYVDSVGQNAELKFGDKSTITSSGDSSIEAKNLDINGTSITASEGSLTLRGISSSTKVGKVVVGNSGVLRLEGSNSKLTTLRANDTINLSASVPYITPDEPLGNGVFGQVVAESVLFESQGTSPLVNLSLSQASSTSAMSDSLFALREGGIMLIDTNSGIKKKTSSADYSNITLEDISSNLGEFTSISLQPYLKYGTDTQGKQIVEDLMLNLQVTQNTVDQLVESIKDSSKKEQMQSLLSSGSNALVIESIMNSKDNPLKAGMALYISNGNVDVVANALEYVTGAFIGLNDSLYASHKVAQGLKMIRATNVENRMVRGKNPHLAKLEVAQLVKRAVGVAYASSDDEILLEDEESGVKDGELWASFDGAMGFSETMGNASVYGFSGGYDTLLGEQKNYLLGFYFGYGYGSYSANFATNNSHNVSLGFYSRMSFENNEVDLILSQSIGLNTAYIDYGATNSYVASMLKQSIDYNFYTTDIEARYGYVFSVGDKENPYYFRPFGGINFAMIVNSEGRGDGEAPIGIDSLITYQLGVSAGVEMRKYFGENYLFLLPMIEKGLLNDGNGTKIGFVGAQSIGYNLPYTVDTGVSVYLGGQGNVGENIAVNGGVGVKVGLESKEVLTNWNLGIRYKF